MCHLADPLEDFARAFGWMWPGGRDEQPGRLIALDKALEIYRSATGNPVNRRDLLWWRQLAAVKGMAIRVSSAQRADSGASDDPLMVVTGWFAVDKQRREIEAFEALFGDAAAPAVASGLSPELFVCADLTPESLRTSELRRTIETLRTEVAALLAAFEAINTDDARALECRTWATISASVDRRKVPGNLFDEQKRTLPEHPCNGMI